MAPSLTPPMRTNDTLPGYFQPLRKPTASFPSTAVYMCPLFPRFRNHHSPPPPVRHLQLRELRLQTRSLPSPRHACRPYILDVFSRHRCRLSRRCPHRHPQVLGLQRRAAPRRSVLQPVAHAVVPRVDEVPLGAEDGHWALPGDLRGREEGGVDHLRAPGWRCLRPRSGGGDGDGDHARDEPHRRRLGRSERPPGVSELPAKRLVAHDLRDSCWSGRVQSTRSYEATFSSVGLVGELPRQKTGRIRKNQTWAEVNSSIKSDERATPSSKQPGALSIAKQLDQNGNYLIHTYFCAI